MEVPTWMGSTLYPFLTQADVRNFSHTSTFQRRTLTHAHILWAWRRVSVPVAPKQTSQSPIYAEDVPKSGAPQDSFTG